MSMQPPPPPPGAVQFAPVSPSAASGYGGFWIRFAAYFIDSLVVNGATFGLLAATKPITCITIDGTTCEPGTTVISPLFWVLIAIPVVYYVVLWAIGGTLGQRITGLRVVDANTGGNLGFGKAILRFIGYLVSVAVVFIGLIWVAFDPRKQGWHDKIAGSLVIRRA